jgi:predicted metal-binding membrane protein
MSTSTLPGAPTSAAGTRARRVPVRWPWALAGTAWALAVLAALTHQTYLIDHRFLLEEGHLPWLLALLLFLACWQVMTLAMMLPSSMPMLTMLIYASRKQARPRAVQAAFLAAYAVVWTGFAVIAFASDSLVHWLVATWPWLAAHPWLIGASTFAVAGAFQFSPLKERCLTACRSPFGFFVRYYRKGVGAAWGLGLRHGMFCLGCCWALMLVMFGVGVGGLAWMVALAGVMTIEKAVPGGRRIGPLVGVALLLLAALWLAQPLGIIFPGLSQTYG